MKIPNVDKMRKRTKAARKNRYNWKYILYSFELCVAVKRAARRGDYKLDCLWSGFNRSEARIVKSILQEWKDKGYNTGYSAKDLTKEMEEEYFDLDFFISWSKEEN